MTRVSKGFSVAGEMTSVLSGFAKPPKLVCACLSLSRNGNARPNPNHAGLSTVPTRPSTNVTHPIDAIMRTVIV